MPTVSVKAPIIVIITPGVVQSNMFNSSPMDKNTTPVGTPINATIERHLKVRILFLILLYWSGVKSYC